MSEKELLQAVEEVLRVEKQPLTFDRIAEGAGIPVQDVAQLLIRAMYTMRAVITFRYPPYPCGAVVSVERRP